MNAARFSVLLADVEKASRTRSWALERDWLTQALEGTEAEAGPASGQVDAELSMTGRDVLVRGRVCATVTMPCARTLQPVEITIDTPLYLLLRPHESARAAGGQPKRGRASRVAEGPHLAANNRKSAKPHTAEDLSDEDAAGDYYEGENIVLDGFVREHLLLELPMFPVRSDLQPEATTANGPPASSSPPEPKQHKPLDPRLGPLAVLAEAMKKPIKE